MKKILFVCTGNTCRSPMAEVILKKKLRLARLNGFKVSSAGTMANNGSLMSENSLKALKLLGYRAYAFRSKQADAKVLLEHDIIICMTRGHKLPICNFPNVYTVDELTGLGDVVDPYGGSLQDYVFASHQIEKACDIIIRILQKYNGEIKL